MVVLLCVALVVALGYIYFNPCHSEHNIYRDKNHQPMTLAFMVIVFASFCIHICGAILYPGHNTDIACFSAWSDMVYADGFRDFYPSESFTDYPPGYMYVLYIIGMLRSVIGNSTLIVKLPAIIVDILAGVGVYKLAQRKFSENTALILSGFILFSPVLILNSALWGQVDIIYTVLLVLAVWLATKKRMIASYFVFGIAFFVKPQALIFVPVIFCDACNVLFNDFSFKKLTRHIMGVAAVILTVVLLSVPFGIEETFLQYIKTLSSYPYATVNAFNIYGAAGLNWEELNLVVSVVGWICIVLISIYVIYEYFKGNKNLFLLSGVLSFATYMLSVKMHERYAFAAVVFFLFAFIFEPKKKTMQLFILTTLSQFINTAWVLFVYESDPSHYFRSPVIVLFSVLNIALFIYMLYVCSKSVKEANIAPCETEKTQVSLFKTQKNIPISKIDAIFILALTLIYGVLSFYNLGDKNAPQSHYDLAEAPVTVRFETPQYIKQIAIYPSCNDLDETRTINISCTNKEGTEEELVVDEGGVFTWNMIDVDKTVTEITFYTDSPRLMIMEAALISDKGVVSVSGNPLFDEQELVPKRQTYLNGTYFDEIYHARTGYEFIHGYNVYEWTHPPLGKVFIAAGIKLFGMTPFGWRFAGNIFGILMVPVFYIMAKKLLGKTYIAFFTTILFTFDFMHFTQTRIATIDVYVTFFIMLMYLFMYRYFQSSFYDTPLKKTFAPLALTGVAFGLGVASKWTAVYACSGIALIYFYNMAVRYAEAYNCKVGLPFMSSFIKSCVFCLLVFIIVPIAIYVVSYIPYLGTENTEGLKTVLENQRDIFIYHSCTVVNSEHPYSSHWYTWPVMVKPIWYYSGTISDTVKEGISAFGNPAVWWTGTAAVLYNIYLVFVKRNRKAAYLLVGYFTCLLPWIPVQRTTYIYHYFPCVPFATLMIGNALEDISLKYKRGAIAAFVILSVVAVALFVLFYPVISGRATDVSFVEKFLRWFSSWVLI